MEHLNYIYSEQNNFDDVINTLSKHKKKEEDNNKTTEDKENKEVTEEKYTLINDEKEHMKKLKFLMTDKIESESESEPESESESEDKGKDENTDTDTNTDINTDTDKDEDEDEDEDEDVNMNEDVNTDEDENKVKNNGNVENDNRIPKCLLNETIIGIDLGTTNTCVSIWKDGGAEIIPDEYGNKLIPSYVAYTNNSRYIGYDAKKQKDINTKNVFYEVKRLIGRKINDKYVKKEKELLSYDIGSDENGNILLKSNLNKSYTPEEISASILTKAKHNAWEYLKNNKITKCVITVPAHFNDGQRQATKDAAKIAGLECIRIINEPTAAALAYGLLERTKKSDIKSKNVLVYDFGGGTLDVSLLNIDDGIFTVLGSSGNMRLGGSDFDTCLIEYCIRKFNKQHKNFKLENLHATSLQKLRISCENAKQLLSTVTETYIAVKEFYENIDLYYKITREDFENLCRDLFFLCIKPINDVLKSSNMSEDKIDEIILVGGMTRTPKIRELLKIKLKKEPNCTINPDEAVAAGAAIQAYLLSHPDNPFSESVTLLDSTALSLGVETIGGLMSTIIKRGEVIPTSGKKIYTTDTDYAKSVKIKVFEGERKMTKDNFCVGEFVLNGIEPKPKGVPEIEVMFNIDVNGIINVSATNRKTREKASMLVTSNKGRLNQNQINLLIEESLDFEIRDELEKRKKWLHYEIEDICSNILINIKSKMTKISENDKKIIKDDINKIFFWLKEKSFEERDDEEYENMIQIIKKKYTVLIMKGKHEDSDTNVKSLNNDTVVATGIYDDTEENEKNIVFEKIEEEEMGFKGLSDPEKVELKNLRLAVNDLCHSILDISDNINLSKDHIAELKDYIDDTLLWMHIHSKITKNEYIDKINEINQNCDRIFNFYKDANVDIFGNNNKKENLEKLCYNLKFMIEDNSLPIKQTYIDELKNTLEQTLNWLIENEENMSPELQTECEKKINIINELCNNINNQMQGINIDEKINIFDNKNIDIPEYDFSEIEFDDENNSNDPTENKGTSIFTIMQRKKIDVMNKMICNDNNDTN